MEKIMGALRERARQLREKRPGYGEIIDFYVNVREAQDTSKTSLRMDHIRLKKTMSGCLGEGKVSLIRKEDFPVDIETSISLFHALCRIAETANPHMAEQVEKINSIFSNNETALEKLLMESGKEEAIDRVAADQGLDRQVLLFLIRNSIRPSIEAGMEQLSGELEPEALLKGHCPVCGCLSSLSLLKGEEGKRYSLCSFCAYQWRIDRLSCAACGSKEQGSLTYFYGEGEEAIRIDLCDTCHHYTKTIDYRKLEEIDPSLEDLATLHLDVVAVQKGYKRPVANTWSV
ncbi:MAG: formate dehydrogenase accessory protein FdhE [Deltaproteobacteria bacterium]